MISTPKFDGGIARLRARHGANSYHDSFSRLLWKFMRYMTDEQFDHMVDAIIGEFRHEPPLSKFKEFSNLARHAIKSPLELVNNQPDTKPSIFDFEETTLFFKTLRGILSGSINKDQKRQMIEYIETRLRGANVKFESVLNQGGGTDGGIEKETKWV